MTRETSTAVRLRPNAETAETPADEPGEQSGRHSDCDGSDSDNPPEPDRRRPAEATRAAAAPDVQVHVDDARVMADTDHVDARWIADCLRRAAGQIAKPIQRISVQLVDETQMKALHQKTFGDPAVTDVISFDNTAEDGPVEADIALCVDVAHRESRQRDHDLERELLLYALHGLLHCCGYDDRDDTGFAAMHETEDRILSAIGVGATFARTGDSAERV